MLAAVDAVVAIDAVDAVDVAPAWFVKHFLAPVNNDCWCSGPVEPKWSGW